MPTNHACGHIEIASDSSAQTLQPDESLGNFYTVESVKTALIGSDRPGRIYMHPCFAIH